jgi:hypothetical protein
MDLKDSYKSSGNKAPKVIFEKPEKQLKVKVLANDYVFNLGGSKDKIKKYGLHSNTILTIRKEKFCRLNRVPQKQ